MDCEEEVVLNRLCFTDIFALHSLVSLILDYRMKYYSCQEPSHLILCDPAPESSIKLLVFHAVFAFVKRNRICDAIIVFGNVVDNQLVSEPSQDSSTADGSPAEACSQHALVKVQRGLKESSRFDRLLDFDALETSLQVLLQVYTLTKTSYEEDCLAHVR